MQGRRYAEGKSCQQYNCGGKEKYWNIQSHGAAR